MMDEIFWDKLDILIARAELEIDRPRGSVHPRYPEVIYPLDYGHLLGTKGSDGDPVDIWVGSDPEQRLTGVLCTVDLHKKDVELKLLLGCTAEEIQILRRFHDGHQAAALLVERSDP